MGVSVRFGGVKCRVMVLIYEKEEMMGCVNS